MVEHLLTLPWRAYPAAALALTGVVLIAAGLTAASGYHRRPWRGPEGALAYLYVFRRTVVGLALIGLSAGWYWQVTGVVAASLCIGLGELLESTYYIEVLRWGQRRGAPWLLVEQRSRKGTCDSATPA